MANAPKDAPSPAKPEDEAPPVEPTTAATTPDFEETVKDSDNVEVLREPVSIIVRGQAVGTARVIRETMLDFKSKEPTGEKLVFLEINPTKGRGAKVRYGYVTAALKALKIEVTLD